MFHVGQPRERRCLHLLQRVVVEQQQPDVGRAGERVPLHLVDLVVSEEDGGDVLEAGEGELCDSGERSVLDGQFAQTREAAEREGLDCADVVPVERELAEVA